MGKSSKSITLALIGSALLLAGCEKPKPRAVAGEWSEGDDAATATQADGTTRHRGGGLIIVPIPRIGGGGGGYSGGGGGAASAPSSRGGFGSSGGMGGSSAT